MSLNNHELGFSIHMMKKYRIIAIYLYRNIACKYCWSDESLTVIAIFEFDFSTRALQQGKIDNKIQDWIFNLFQRQSTRNRINLKLQN
jgi:hypothetical protein